MNWLLKIIKNIIPSKKNALEKELEESGGGRAFGWYVEYEGKRIGELVDAKFEDMFWYSYKLIVYKEYESIVLDIENWHECKFQYLNKHYLQYAENAHAGGIDFSDAEDDIRIPMRALYL